MQLKSPDLKVYKPITPSLRHRAQINYSLILSNKSKFKKLIKGCNKTGGRNNFGRLTSFNKGGGHKKTYRFLSNDGINKNIPGSFIDSIEYDPFRTSFINCCFFKNAGFFQYTLSAQKSKKGTFLVSNYANNLPYEGAYCSLIFSKIGDFLYNINLKKSTGYHISRSAGTFCKIMNKEPENNIAKVLLPSGALYKVSLFSSGFLGKVSNSSHRFKVLSKAGRNRWLGKRPSVRGSAMNPIDHPHGGGEGGKSGGKPSRTPWGFPTQGYPTRKYKKNKYFIRLIKKRSK